jgi:predicted LPLAT superfamily acyltransferase
MTHWSQIEEQGIVWGMDFLLRIYRLCGPRIFGLFIFPVVGYYWLTNKHGRDASQQYLRRVTRYLPEGQIQDNWHGTFLHFVSFANSLVDKLVAWTDTSLFEHVEFHGRDQIKQHFERGQGVLILGSHLGNLEVGRAIAHIHSKVKVNVLVHTHHAEKFNSLLSRHAKAGRLNLFQVTDINAATAIVLKDKIDAGELVIIAADRTSVSDKKRVVQAKFLGASASFPQGPIILGALFQCPVYTMFCLKQSGKHMIYFDHFSDGIVLRRKQREADIQKQVQIFAKRLEYYCLKEPLQWFNFYEFWHNGND